MKKESKEVAPQSTFAARILMMSLVACVGCATWLWLWLSLCRYQRRSLGCSTRSVVEEMEVSDGKQESKQESIYIQQNRST